MAGGGSGGSVFLMPVSRVGGGGGSSASLVFLSNSFCTSETTATTIRTFQETLSLVNSNLSIGRVSCAKTRLGQEVHILDVNI